MSEERKEFYKKNPGDKIWWVDYIDEKGIMAVSFDKETVLNIFEDYPQKFTPEQKALFDKENPYWKDFFKDRQ